MARIVALSGGTTEGFIAYSRPTTAINVNYSGDVGRIARVDLTGDVFVSNLRLGRVVENGKWALATIDISIPGGELS